MEKDILALLGGYFEKARAAVTPEELEEAERELSQQLEKSSSRSLEELRQQLREAAEELMTLREQFKAVSGARRDELSEKEKQELARVTEILDANSLCYHYQPIVRADTGEIFAYEALMRPVGAEGITPFHILRYAAITGRLGEVEEKTFLNVLGIITDRGQQFFGRKVFINSMPDVHASAEKRAEIDRLLGLYHDRVVVEMTESSEFSEATLESIKAKFAVMGIETAIDDFGTGYSNISNLLRYTPNYVKIDRSLMSGIESDRKKKHFVREIIDICRENGIMSLAEGVETNEELRTVILLGVDLIQGFCTARPSPEAIKAIPYAMRAKIRALHQEREDGKALRIYNAEDGERVSLEKLHRDGCNRIVVGTKQKSGSVYIYGSPTLDTDIHIETVEGFSGRIELENARLSNRVSRPCIDIGEGGEVTLVLSGTSRLENSGIRVPAGATLRTEGKGDLEIKLGSADYYGIGNDMSSPHGELVFEQDGTISVSADSHSGTCIGSGLGGKISIRRGRYVLRSGGGLSVCMGSFEGPTEINIIGCDLEAVASGAMSVCMGSMYSDAEIDILYSSIRCNADGQYAAGLGTIQGQRAHIKAESINMGVNVNADAATAIGALHGGSDIRISRSGVRLSSVGTRALSFGGLTGGTALGLTDIDLSAELATTFKVCIIAKEKDIETVGGKYRVTMGDHTVDRLIY
ncbi:MAG: EAL domain-containing protein [Ruminococcus sp.]|nr:EAL domain-containing protein [Ruminococcus sp.]